jgi:hypothetical protein
MQTTVEAKTGSGTGAKANADHKVGEALLNNKAGTIALCVNRELTLTAGADSLRLPWGVYAIVVLPHESARRDGLFTIRQTDDTAADQ